MMDSIPDGNARSAHGSSELKGVSPSTRSGLQPNSAREKMSELHQLYRTARRMVTVRLSLFYDLIAQRPQGDSV
jgi:hypothetical protein